VFQKSSGGLEYWRPEAMNKTALKEVVSRAVAGDLEAFRRLLEHPPAQVEALRDTLPELVVTKQGLLRVVSAFASKAAPPELVQQWASSVRWGLYGIIEGGRHSLHISYDSRKEDEIADVVGRLDELGDLIDGVISEKESSAMLRTLQADDPKMPL
jgi:hypothetical protein